MASVTSRNPFELLSEDVEEVKVSKQKASSEKTAKKPSAPKSASDKSRAKPNEARIRRDYPARGGFKNLVARGAPEAGDAARKDAPTSGGRGFERSGRGGNPRFRGRGGREAPGRGREFDRHSATGRRDTDKQVNQGWGHPGDQWEVSEQWGESKDTQNENKDQAGSEQEQDQQPSVPQEPVIKTLDQYYAELASKTAKLSLPEPRRPNEGIDKSQIVDAVPLQKTDEAYFPGKESSNKPKKSKDKPTKATIELEHRFSRPNPRSRPPPRSNIDSSKSNKTIDVSDPSAFPSLGSK